MQMSFLKRGRFYIHYKTLCTTRTAPATLEANAKASPGPGASTSLGVLAHWLHRYVLPACRPY
jgi:hypothetical protein